jgi:hypothetical protein
MYPMASEYQLMEPIEVRNGLWGWKNGGRHSRE